MHEWSESQEMIRDAVRRFLEAEVAPHVEELEHGDLPPYDILRKLFATFGMEAYIEFDPKLLVGFKSPRRSCFQVTCAA